jgi:AcrR family transcriptional regulator
VLAAGASAAKTLKLPAQSVRHNSRTDLKIDKTQVTPFSLGGAQTRRKETDRIWSGKFAGTGKASSAPRLADQWGRLFSESRLTMENDRSTLNPMNTTTTDTREKILATAESLIYQNGIHAMGMDLLVKTSGVARKSIYRHFATKDEVAACALNARDVRWMQWFRTESNKAETPRSRILNMFTVLKGWFESEGFCGCAFINTAGEVGNPNDPIRLIAKLHKQKLFDYTLELCEQLEIEQPSVLAKQLLILMEGAITVARVMGDYTAADGAKDVAQMLLKQASP